MATSARDLWWESCFSNSTVIASTLARKTQRKWSWSWRAGTSTKQAISLFFAPMPRSEKDETAFPCPKTPQTVLRHPTVICACTFISNERCILPNECSLLEEIPLSSFASEFQYLGALYRGAKLCHRRFKSLSRQTFQRPFSQLC